MTETLAGSTGSTDLDDNVDRHVVVIEGIGHVEIPGLRPLQQVVFNGVHYTHAANDAEGHWTYRPL